MIGVFAFCTISFFQIAYGQVITPKSAQLVAASVASIDGRMISLRDTQLAEELQKSLAKVKASEWAVELDAVSQSVLNIIAAKEAKSFQIAEVTESESIEAMRKIKNSEVVRRLKFKDSELREFVNEKILAEKFLVLRSEGLRTVLTDQEVKDYYEKNKLTAYKNMSYEKFKETIRRDLELEYRQKRFLEWFDVLKQKYKVRIYGQPHSPADNK